jgi:stage V sporulation protein G
MSNKEPSSKLEIRAYPIAEPKGNILGSATIALDTPIGNLAVRDIRIVNGQNGPFIAMPQTKDKDGNYKDLVFPITKEGRAQLNNAVLDAYAAAKEKAQEKPSVKDQLREGVKAPKEKSEPDKAKTPKKSDPDR